MKVPLSWLKDYVEIDLSPNEIAARLTLAGTEVSDVRGVTGWDRLLVGQVTDVRQHPNADRLKIVKVDTGDGKSEVVCGAPNVDFGQKVAFAQVGAELMDANIGERKKLKRAKIRGVISEGMVCSRQELGLGEDHDGILVLQPDAPIGKPLSEYLGDVIFDLELTPNRPDCLGVLGVAREVAAVTGKELRVPPAEFVGGIRTVDELAKVVIHAPDLCTRYTASVIENIVVGPSPSWLAERIEKLGERPINNIVDITNYVMFEFGQPLHAFDHTKVRDHEVNVRRAHDGERLVTLDGKERVLTSDMLVIADSDRSIGLAGVIGGANTQIVDSTTSVLLESATFRGSDNRRTARTLGLASQATLRFEKDLRPELSEIALRRATKMIVDIAGGSAAQGIIDVWPGQSEVKGWVDLPADKIKRVLGLEIPDHRVRSTLEALNFQVEDLKGKHGVNVWRVHIPYWRSDINIPEDLCEELARIIGYDEIPITGLSGTVPSRPYLPQMALRERVRDVLVSTGLQETITYYASTIEGQEQVQAAKDRPAPMRLFNPVSSELGYLRTTLREGLLRTVLENSRVWQGPLALFEMGRVFIRQENDLPEEREMAVGIIAGPKTGLNWLGDNDAQDFYDGKGVVETVFASLGVEAAYEKSSDEALQEGRVARITAPSAAGITLGVIGEVSERLLEILDIEVEPVIMFEIDLGALSSAIVAADNGRRVYRPFSRMPRSNRDLALVADDHISAAELVRVVERNKLVISATVFDVYRGEEVSIGKKSLGVRVIYQSQRKTLTAGEIDRAEQAILHALKKQLGVELRV